MMQNFLSEHISWLLLLKIPFLECYTYDHRLHTLFRLVLYVTINSNGLLLITTDLKSLHWLNRAYNDAASNKLDVKPDMTILISRLLCCRFRFITSS